MSFTFATSTKEVLEQVVREPRFRAITTIPLLAPMEIGLVVAVFALFGVTSVLYLNGSIHWLPMIAINSFAVYASFTPLHDATHRTVSSNRRVNDTIGTISCLLLLPGITTRIYRYLHLEHHRYSGNEEKDPDEAFVSAPRWALPFVLAGLDVLWSRWYISHWSTRPVGERREYVVCIGFYIFLHVAFLSSPYALEFILIWMIPQRLGLFYVAWFFAHIQHPKGVLWEEAPFQATVRVMTNPLARWLLLGQSKHHIHHLAPSVPYYRYHQAWNLGRHLFEQQNIPTRTLFAPSRDLRTAQPAQATWLQARVSSVLQIADDVRQFEFVPAQESPWPAFTPGSHIDVCVGKDRVRQYSLCNAPSEQDRYVIAVRDDPHGRGGSHYANTEIKPGDTMTIGTPRNNFPLREQFDEYVLVAGGIGVTPLLSMAYRLHEIGKSFTLHLCARSRQAIPFRDQLNDFPFTDRIQLHFDDHDHAQRFEPASDVGKFEKQRVLYLCGPSGFMSSVIASARESGWDAEHIFSETFVPPAPSHEENQRFEVELARSGKVLAVEAHESLLDVLNNNDCPVICSCTQGICGSCMTPVLSGVPEHRDAVLTDAERDANNQMTVCVSRAKSARIVLDL